MTNKYAKKSAGPARKMADGGFVGHDESEWRGGVPEDYRRKTASAPAAAPKAAEPEVSAPSPRPSRDVEANMESTQGEADYGNESRRTKQTAAVSKPKPAPKKPVAAAKQTRESVSDARPRGESVSTPKAPQKAAPAPFKPGKGFAERIYEGITSGLASSTRKKTSDYK